MTSSKHPSEGEKETSTTVARHTPIVKLIRLLYQPYKVLVFAPFLALNSIVMGGLGIILATLFNARTGMRFGGIPWAKFNTLAALAWVRVKNRDRINPNQSYVVVSNHQSVFDIFALVGWLNMDIRLVAKASLRKVPVFGIASAKMDHIFIDRTNSQAALKTINDARKNIVNGTSVLFFPEGTRSEDGKLKEFKVGAFKMALGLGIPILPVTVRGTREILPSGTLDLLPGKAEIIIHPPIDINKHSQDTMKELIQETQVVIGSALH